MTLEEYKTLLLTSGEFSGKILENEKLSKYSTMNVGGDAGLFVEPDSEAGFVFALKEAVLNRIDFFLLGGGSNTIFPDEGIPLVITSRLIKDQITYSDSTLRIPAGASWGAVISFCKNSNLRGFECFTGLSGSAGGALFMNATCFGLSACHNLLSAEYLDKNDCTVKIYKKDPKDWGYKKSPFQAGDKVILSAVFNVKKGFDEAKSAEVLEKRKTMGHFKAPSAGSAFKNKPEEGIIAGKIIDECGLKGFSCGGAQIAPWHGNFIINPEKKASCADIKALVEKVQETVLQKTGIKLESEILFV